MGTHQEDPLLPQKENFELYAGDGSVDIKGNPVLKANTGSWRACPFIISTEFCERLAYYGISTNLVSYLTKYLHQGNASAATTVTTWKGTCHLTPLFGGFLADAYWGRYSTIAVFSTIYFIGMCTLTLSASITTHARNAVFFFGLYLIALGAGGIKPCVSSFGADQFDDNDPAEKLKKGSFFNWYYFAINIGALASSTIIVWIQENVGWGVGFAIPAVFMAIVVASFLSGTRLYRFQKPGGSPLTRICQVLVASFRKRNLNIPTDIGMLYESQDDASAIKGSRKLLHTDQLRCLDKAAIISDAELKTGDFSKSWRLCTITQVEELKRLIQMFPIWATGIFFSVMYTQLNTLSVEQGMTMETVIGSFNIPAASLSCVNIISILVWVPIYDTILVPVARKITRVERGFSELQRMGIGLFLSILSMLGAALVETKRLQVARDGDKGNLSILWQVPQYGLMGAAEVFRMIGQTEFIYDQSPDSMRSLCSALALLAISLGNYLGSLMVSVVTSVTSRGGKTGWITDDLKQGHLDYYFLLLAFLGFLNMLAYILFSMSYKSKQPS